ncbi:MAG: PEGA domain-containing protein [Thiobacillus sp.]
MTLFHSSSIKWLSLLAAAATLSGCAGTGSVSDNSAGRIKITSEPAGAIAYADGAELGATPLQIVPGNHFRSGFMGFSYRYIGKLSIKKPGCDTWSTEVNDFILSKDVHAKLKCDPNYQPPAASSPVTGSPAGSDARAPSGDAVERLERIEALRKKGLISEEEYTQLRARIIDRL